MSGGRTWLVNQIVARDAHANLLNRYAVKIESGCFCMSGTLTDTSQREREGKGEEAWVTLTLPVEQQTVEKPNINICIDCISLKSKAKIVQIFNCRVEFNSCVTIKSKN